MGDYSYSTILFLVSLAVFQQWNGKTFPASVANVELVQLFLIFLVVQWVFDIMWASLVLMLHDRNIKNKYTDFFARYGREVGVKAIIGDSIYLAALYGLTIALYYKTNDLAKYLLLAIGLFVATILSYK